MFIKNLLDILPFNNDEGNIEYYNNNETTKALFIYKKFLESNSSVVVIVETKKEAEKLAEKFLNLNEVYIFPELDLFRRYLDKSNDLEQISEEILFNLITNKKMILIVTVNSLFRTIKKPEDFQKNILEISYDNFPNFENLPQILIDMGYKYVDSVQNIGEFSKRGSIIDIFSSLNSNPVRIDYFDSEIDSIRIFDLETQKSIDKIENYRIYPNGEFFLTNKEKEQIIQKIKEKLKSKPLINDEYKEIKKEIEEKINLFYATKDFGELSNFSNYIYENVYSIVDYIKKDSILLFNNFNKIKDKEHSFKEYFKINLSEINSNYIFQKIVDDSCFDKLMHKENKKYYLSTLRNNENNNLLKIDLNINDIPFFSSEKEFIRDINIKLKQNYYIVISYNTNSQIDYIEKILIENDLHDYISDEVNLGKIYIKKTEYNFKGFESEKNRISFYTPYEIFKDYNKIKRKKANFKYSNSEKIRNYQELNIGDYIVHIHHGIGIYQGIENIEIQCIYKDFLKISYEGSDVIYVDIENMKYIQKYTSSNDGRIPKLNKLGTKTWNQVKNKVKKEIENISYDLIKLYIKRELSEGYAFSKDSFLQKEFEQDFLFTPTKDQITAYEEIKLDMESTKPMDRLLCGDVGFGKTEVAMRAAFKAVIDNKQVAILVPTTLLAEQHYNNFINRFENFPINIDVVSRFKTKKEINIISNKLISGKIDIIIGTHKLLNDNFIYKDLGLLIIDEEQRFGVKHKEKIKQLKNIIDVLTLSATPIPRTLHMSLIGLRDLSVIKTPPINRQPIQTFVLAENYSVIKEVILKEIEREGQVFYLYNKVESIEEKYYQLKNLLPEINIAYAHGRMSQKQLEDVMFDLINKKYDMLITTTIIETGIDISNVNTLIVEDADKFGLSQLYQIRGRVGRSSREAYAYFMYKPNKILTENSEKRLTAIKNFTTLGSGFRIAMQDLTIRGAGDVLGGKQHGFIDSVGYSLYSQMLEKEISEKKEILEPLLKNNKYENSQQYEEILKEKIKLKQDERLEEEQNIEIKLLKNAYIPKDYIKNDADKIYFYKKLNTAKSENDISEIIEELIDRYSEYGEELDNLINICLLKISSKEIKVKSVTELANKIVVIFEKEILENLDGKLMFTNFKNLKKVRILVKETLSIEIEKENNYSIKDIRKILLLVKNSLKESLNE